MPVNTIPKRYRFKFGEGEEEKGWVIEEVYKEYETWEPAIQYLVAEDGTVRLRFCYYRRVNGKRERLVRMPPTYPLEVLKDLSEEIKKSHAVKSLLKVLLGLESE